MVSYSCQYLWQLLGQRAPHRIPQRRTQRQLFAHRLLAPRRQRELETALEDAGAAKTTAGFDFGIEREEEEQITRMMNEAQISAREDGVLMYSSPDIAEGCTVEPNQPILWCAPHPTPEPAKEGPKR